MSVIQSIRARSVASLRKARARDEEDSDKVAPVADESDVDTSPDHAPPPPGMGKLVDRTV